MFKRNPVNRNTANKNTANKNTANTNTANTSTANTNKLLNNQNDCCKRNRILVQYVKYACNLPISLFHECLIDELLNITLGDALVAKKTSNELIRRDLIFKNIEDFFIMHFLLLSNINYSKYINISNFQGINRFQADEKHRLS